MKSRLFSIILLIAIVILSTNTIFSDTITRFSDIPENAPYANAVKYCFDNRLMTGTSDTEFSPAQNTSRAMLVTILHRQEEAPKGTIAPFIDVAKNEWYYDAVNWASTNGIVSGYDSEHFAPNDLLTREQILTILWRYAGEKTIDTNLPYIDIASISDYAVSAVKWAYINNIIADKQSSKLNPSGHINRSEMAVILYNYSNMNSSEKPINPTTTENNENKSALSITFGSNGTPFIMTLENNKTTAFFAEFIGNNGINLPVYDFDNSEYMQYYEIPKNYAIPATTQTVTTQKCGDVYYADNRIILFYQDANETGEYVKIGHIDNTNGLKEAVENNPVLAGWGNKIISINNIK